MNNSEYICDKIERGALGKSQNFTLHTVGVDLDGETAHCLIWPETNECAALIAVIVAASYNDIRVVGLHHLHGKLNGYIELDLQAGGSKIPKSFGIYDPVKLSQPLESEF